MPDNETDNVTTFEVVTKGYKPPVPSSDQEFVEDAIDEAELLLSNRLGDLQEWIDAAPTPALAVMRKKRLTRAVTRSVRRVMRNPDGFTSESAGDYSYARAGALSSGEVYIGAAEWKMLGFKARGFKTIRLGLPQDSPRNVHHTNHRHRRLP